MKRTKERRKTDMLLSFESGIHQRESEQDHRNTVALLMEEWSERELLQETWFGRKNSSAYR
jgi:hypothetical protein